MPLRKMPLGIQWKILLIVFLMKIFWEVYLDFGICFQTHAIWPDMSEIELKSENTTQKPANSAKIAILILTVFSKFEFFPVRNFWCGQENVVDPKKLFLFSNPSLDID